MPTYSIRELSSEEKLDFFCLAKSRGESFIEFASTHQNSILILGFFRNDQLIGGMTLTISRYFLLKIVKSPTFFPYAMFLNPNVSDYRKPFSEERQISTLISRYLKNSPKFRFTHLTLPVDYVDVLPFIWNGHDVRPFFTNRLDLRFLSIGQIENLDFADKDLKRNLNRSKCSNVEVSQANNIDEVSSFLDYEKIEFLDFTSKDKLKKIISFTLNSPANGRTTVARVGENLVGINVSIILGKTSYMIFNYTSKGWKFVSSALIEESLFFSKNLKLDFFDFEGTMNKNIDHFFRQFYGRLMPYWSVISGPFWFRFALRFRQRRQFLK